jgi:hypothetical protein
VAWKRTPWLWGIIAVNVLVMALALVLPDPDAFILGGALDPKEPYPWAWITGLVL